MIVKESIIYLIITQFSIFAILTLEVLKLAGNTIHNHASIVDGVYIHTNIFSEKTILAFTRVQIQL